MIEITLKFPLDEAGIKEAATKIRGQIAERDAEIKALRGALRTLYSQCKHKHPDSGYNERDGSWASPCIHCGYSY